MITVHLYSCRSSLWTCKSGSDRRLISRYGPGDLVPGADELIGQQDELSTGFLGIYLVLLNTNIYLHQRLTLAAIVAGGVNVSAQRRGRAGINRR